MSEKGKKRIKELKNELGHAATIIAGLAARKKELEKEILIKNALLREVFEAANSNETLITINAKMRSLLALVAEQRDDIDITLDETFWKRMEALNIEGQEREQADELKLEEEQSEGIDGPA